MVIISGLKTKLTRRNHAAATQETFDPEHFVYVMIPDPMGPLERGEKYEDKLDPLLQARGCGQ